MLLALAGCGEKIVYLTPEEAAQRRAVELEKERARIDVIQKQLPAGCVFKDYGEYNNGRTWLYITAIHCGKTVTTNQSWRYGKSTRYASITTQSEDAP